MCPSTPPVMISTTGRVSPTYPVIARKFRYDSAGFSPQAVLIGTIACAPSRLPQERLAVVNVNLLGQRRRSVNRYMPAGATDEELARLRRSFTLADLAPLAAAARV